MRKTGELGLEPENLLVSPRQTGEWRESSQQVGLAGFTDSPGQPALQEKHSPLRQQQQICSLTPHFLSTTNHHKYKHCVSKNGHKLQTEMNNLIFSFVCLSLLVIDYIYQ